MFTDYSSWKGFLSWKQASEENFCWLFLMVRPGGDTWWNIWSEILRVDTTDLMVKAGKVRGAVQRQWSLQTGCKPCKLSAIGLSCKMKMFQLSGKNCHVAAYQHPPILSCKGSYELSSFFPNWSSALRLLCYDLGVVHDFEHWCQIIWGKFSSLMLGNSILGNYCGFLNLWISKLPIPMLACRSSSAPLHLFTWARKRRQREKKGDDDYFT